MKEYYLDEASTTKPDDSVVSIINHTMKSNEDWYNPSSLYSKSSNSKWYINKTKERISHYINSNPNEIYFTSSGSESNCMAIEGFIKYYCKENPVVITSTIEHNSIRECLRGCKDCFTFTYKEVKVNEDGFVNLGILENYVSFYAYEQERPVLVSIQFANNEIGTIQYIEEISKITNKYNVVFHTDATQAFGKFNIDVDKLGIDMMTASGHKIGCPKGIAFLFKRDFVKIKPIVYGTQMNGLRGGTENIPYIAGLCTAITNLICDDSIGERNAINIKERDYFIKRLEGIGCRLNGVNNTNRLSNNINVILPFGISGESMLYVLDASGIYISTGSACNSKSIEPSHVLKAIGLTDEEAKSSIRITFDGRKINNQDIDYIVNEIEKNIKLFKAEMKEK